jgi:hypothetical protein
MNKWNCGFCQGLKLLVLGALILLNQFYLKWDFWVFLGMLFVIWGFIGLFSHKKCACEMPMEMPKKRKR